MYKCNEYDRQKYRTNYRKLCERRNALYKVYSITHDIVVEWGNAAGVPFGFGVHDGVDLFVEFPT